MIKRITVSLPDDLSELVTREAERRQVSASHLVRLSLTAMLRPPRGRDVPWAGVVNEPAMVYGADLDEAFEEEWPEASAGR